MPRIQTTPMVKIALIALRVYLVVMLGLILVKFLRIFDSEPPATKGPGSPKPAATRPAEGR
jgi:hypothetical protein